MKKFLSYLVFLSTAFVLLNCNSGRKSERLSKIDTLQAMLDSTQIMLTETINYDSVLAYYNKLKINQDKIGSFFKKMNEKEKSDYFQFLSTEKQFKIFVASFEEYKNELDYSKNQISTLRKDVEGGNLTSNQFKEYFESENKAVVALFHSVKMDVYKTSRNVEKFLEFEPKVSSLISKYQEKN